MAIDVMAQDFVTESGTNVRTGGGTGTRIEYTPYSKMYDGDGATYWGGYWRVNGDDMHNLQVTTAETTWTDPVKISSLVASSYQYQASDGDAYTASLNYTRFYLYLKINGSYSLIDSKEVTSPSSHGGSTSQTHFYNGSTGWINVTGVKYILQNARTSDSGEFNPGQYITLDNRIYTITANLDWEASGIKMNDNGTIINIAGHPIDGDPLRYYDGSSTLGIPLVETTSSLASPIRVYDGSSVKSLAKYS